MRFILSLLVLFCLPLMSQADVIVQDPNTASAQRETKAVQSADPRLTQKITCALGYTRLHTAVEELSKLSGVTIRCGTNNDDWHVRDIPVVVWVKDLPLGKVLETLAAASHTQLTSTRMDDIISYRISSRLERQIANYEQEKQKAIIEGLKWDWDTAVKLKDLPDSAYKPGKDPKSQAEYTGLCIPDRIACARAAGTVLSLLGPQIRDKIIDSDGSYQVNWDDASPALRTALLDLGRATVEQHRAIMIRQTKGSFDASTLPRVEACKVSLSFTCRKDVSSTSELEMGVNLQDGDIGGHFYGTDLGRDTSSLVQFVNGIDLGKRPTCPELPTDEPPADYIKLAKADDGNDPQQLQKMVTLISSNRGGGSSLPIGVVGPVAKWTPPTSNEDVTTADALVELAKTAGFSIVSADFQSQLDTPASLMFGKERSIADVLRRFNQLLMNADLVPYGGRDWFVDDKNSLILGRSIDWIHDYNNLVPEKLVARLTDKLRGDGVLLDDVMPVTCLSKGQLYEWFTMSREMQPLNDVVFHLTHESYGSWWKLQSRLSNDQKTVAESKEGLPLSLVDPTEALRALDGCSMGKMVAEQVFGSVDAIDPQELRYFTWHVRRSSQSGKQLMQGTVSIQVNGQSTPQDSSAAAMSQIDSVDWHTWQISLDYDKGDTHTGSFSALGPFPVFSPKRLAELQAQAEKAKGK